METGLLSGDIQKKLREFGYNEIAAVQKKSPLALFLSQFPSVLNGILAIAGAFSFLISDVLDGIFIFAILILNALFGFIQEYRAEKSLEKLKELLTPLSRVIRNGQEVQIPTREIVPGDIVIISEGDRIPADGIIKKSYHIEIDESVLTGESVAVIKEEKEEVYSGTLVTRGKAFIRISATGTNTRFGKIAETLSTIEDTKTPLQKKLDSLGKALSFLALGVAASLVPIGLFHHTPLFPLLLLAISIGVAAVPEGLPAIVTIALGIGTSRMARKDAIIRNLPSVETLGAVQYILMDKTGTLTQNQMSVKKHWVTKEADLPLIYRACVLGNTATLVKKANNTDIDVLGDKTDGALISWVNSKLDNLDSFKKQGDVVDEFVFDPDTKTVATIWKNGKTTSVFVRGAPEEIIAKSTLSPAQKNKLIALVNSYAKEGLRVIAFATKSESHIKNPKRSHIESNLSFLGVVGIYDPPRPEARAAILAAKRAGVEPIMITGDNELTAVTIAKEVGLIDKNDDVLSSDELHKLTDEQLKKVILKTKVFARAKPEDKLRLTRILQGMGYVVAVTGDGVNDALALKQADVGIAMGEAGTDVAKEAADIVLTNDNFSTIVSAIDEGRTIYSNIVKSITYLLSGNLAEVSLVLLALLFNLPTPMLPTQILWINLVTDGLPSLALASDTKDPRLIKSNPRDPKSPILTNNLYITIGGIGIGLAVFLLIVFYQLIQSHNEIFARSVIFNLLIVLHVLIAFVVRGGSVFRMNKFLVGSVILTFLLQLIISITPPLQSIFHIHF